MESCPECGSTDIDELATDPDCEGCSVMECDGCDVQFARAEMVGVDHTHDLDNEPERVQGGDDG